VSAQLEQLVGYLDREGVTEVVISVGRPIAMRQREAFVNLTARPLTSDQLLALLRGSPLATMVPARDGMSDPAEVEIGKRRARVQVGRRGEEIVVRLERAVRAKSPSMAPPIRAVETTRAKSHPDADDSQRFISTPRAKSPTALTPPEPEPEARVRTKSPTGAPRPKSPTGAPRTKSTTAAPRTKSTTAAPRTKPTTGAPKLTPRAKTPSAAPKPPPPPPEAMSLDIDLGSLSGARTAAKRAGTELGTPVGQKRLDLDFISVSDGNAFISPGEAPADASLGTLGGPPPVAAGELELDPSMPALDLDPADARASFDPTKEMTDARPTWNVGVNFAGRATPLPVAAEAARSAAMAASAARSAAVPSLPGLTNVQGTKSARPALSTPVLADGPLAQLVKRARERGASDLHVASGRPVSIRTGGELVALDLDRATPAVLSVAAAEAMLLPLLDAALRAQLDRLGYADLAVPLASGGRLRTNITRHQAGLKGTFRLAMPAPSTLEELGLPKDLAKVVGHHQGLVVIAGPSGHGKTTTLAALVDLVNATKPYHILTVEDPIEIVYARKAAVVSQREAGRHTKSFGAALKASLREDPDVIVIGELRDRETVEIALTASETGHLVLATMSTPSAAKTLDRLIDMFPPDEHPQVRASIAGALRAIVAQRLLPSRDGKVAAAIELVTGVLPLAVLIRDDKLFQLPNLMQRGRAFGMIRFDDSLAELVRTGRITEETAMSIATSKTELTAALRRPS
jgi:twitching motility protein PilT